MAQSKGKLKSFSMQDKYGFHSNRAYKNHKPAGSKMTKAEKVAYSAGYVAHARQTAQAYKYNLALDMGATKKDARAIANNPKIHFNDRVGRFERTK